MRRFALVAIVLLALAAPPASAPAHAALGYAVGDTAVDFGAYDQNGTFYSLSDFAGQWVVLDFCASWCFPCRAMAPAAQQLYDAWSGNTPSLEYLTCLVQGPTFAPSTQDDASAWAGEFSNTRPVLHAGGGVNAPLRTWFYGAGFNAVPTIVYVDPDRVIRSIHVGFQSSQAMYDTLVALIAPPAPPPPPPPPPLPVVQDANFFVRFGPGGGATSSTAPGEPLVFSDFGGGLDGVTNAAGVLSRSADLTTGIETWDVRFGDFLGEPIGVAQAWTVRILSPSWSDGQPRERVPGSPRPKLRVFYLDGFGEQQELPTNVEIADTLTATGLELGPVALSALPGLPASTFGFGITPIQLRRVLAPGNVGVEDGAPATAAVAPFALRAPAPNPARESATIGFTLAREARVRLEIVDLAGRRIARLADGDRAPGAHAERWDLRDDAGRLVAPGLYLARLSSGAAASVRRIAVLR